MMTCTLLGVASICPDLVLTWMLRQATLVAVPQMELLYILIVVYDVTELLTFSVIHVG